MINFWLDRVVLFIILTWVYTLTPTIHHRHVPNLGETISSHSRTSNHEESPRTIFLQDPRYESKTVEISSKLVTVHGTIPSRPTIFESQQVKGTLLHVTNSTASFSNLAFQPLTVRILTVINHSECLVANSIISVIEDGSPIECSDSTVRVLNSEFDFSTSQNHSPSLSTTASTSSTVSFHSCSFSDVVVTAPGSYVSCSSVQTSQTDRCLFSNISHCPPFCKPSLAPLFHTVSVLNTHFVDCENVLFGGVVRDTEDRTSLLAANTTFTRSRSTYTNITGKSFGPTTTTTAQVVSVDHRYEQCTFLKFADVNVNGGGIRCESGANLAVDNCSFIESRNTRDVDTNPTEGGGICMQSGAGVGGSCAVSSQNARPVSEEGFDSSAPVTSSFNPAIFLNVRKLITCKNILDPGEEDLHCLGCHLVPSVLPFDLKTAKRRIRGRVWTTIKLKIRSLTPISSSHMVHVLKQM